MTDPITVFLFGPFYFIPLLLTYSGESIDQIQMFVISGLGTAFWVAIISAVYGVSK